MKCIHCGAEWTTGKGIPALGKCPFCGNYLTVSIADRKGLSMSRVLQQMVEIYGPDILSDRKKCIAIFKDLAPELKDEQQILSAALTSGVGDFFASCPNSERESNIKKAIHSMDYLSSDAKRMVVTSLIDALGWDKELALKDVAQDIEIDGSKDLPERKKLENVNNGNISHTPPLIKSSNQVTGIIANNNTINTVSSPKNNTTQLPSIFIQNKAIIGIALLVIVVGYMFFSSVRNNFGNNSQSPVSNFVVNGGGTGQYFIAKDNGEMILYKDAYYDREPIVAKVKKDEKIQILKNEDFKMYRKGMIISDREVVGTDDKKYSLKKGTSFELLGKETKPADNGETNYVIKLGNTGNQEISAIVNGLYISPMYDGNWWYVKTNDGKMGWYKPYGEERKRISSYKSEDMMAFMTLSEAVYLGFGGKDPYDTQANDGEKIRFVGDGVANAGILKLISKSNNKPIFEFRDFDGRGGVEYYIRSITTKHPELDLWEISAIAGTHAKNCGYWLVGKEKGKWSIYISDKELATAGYNINRWHQLHSRIENNKLILKSSTEYYPPGAQFGYQRTHITEMEFEIYWDYNANTLKLRYVPMR